MTTPYPHLFEPIKLGPLQVKNRLAMTPHSGAGRGNRYFEDRARGGCGLMIINDIQIGVYGYSPAPGRFDPATAGESDAVPPDPSTPEGIRHFDALVIPRLREIAQMLHGYGVVMVSQLAHLGAAPTVASLIAPVGPSAYRDEEAHSVAFALEEEHVGRIVVSYGQAARRAREAGADAVELHAAHGYLLEQFLSPYTNKRADRYGGSPEKRLTFFREILASIDRLAGPDFPVGLRIAGGEFTDKGLSVGDVAAIVAAVQDRLIYVNVSGGTTTGLMDILSVAYASPWHVPAGYNAAAAATIKRSSSVPVLLTGKILNPPQAERLIADGTTDLIGMARGWLADPDWGVKAQAGEEVRPCIGTNECHSMDRRISGGGIRCTVNPAAGREEEMTIFQAPVRRRVLIAGGGPAGLQAARTAALRGHEVVLCEKSDCLGGQARVMALDPTHQKLREWLGYLERKTREAGAEIRTGVEVTPDFVAAQGYGVVVAATGATPFRPDIPGITSPLVVTSAAVLEGEAEVGRSALVIAGLDDHLGPLSIADVLAQRGHVLTLTCEAVSIGMAIEPRTLHQALRRLLEKDVRLLAMTRVTGIHDHTVATRNILTGKEGRIEDVDTVVLSLGGVANDALARQLRGGPAEVHRVGDALAPRRIIHAVLEGARVAMTI